MKFTCCSNSFDLDRRVLIMGVLNVTPDSFSDGGDNVVPDLAIANALAMIDAGADIIDIADPANRGKPDYAYINGTLHGNPVAAVAGLATLGELEKPGTYERLHANADRLIAECQKVLDRHHLPAIATGGRSLWQILHTDRPPVSHADVMGSDLAATRALDLAQMKHGLYVLPNVRRFVSCVHTEQDFEDTVEALDAACRMVA